MKRVLVFGSGGVGKTSLCNELAHGTEAIGSSVVGVTFESKQTAPVTHGGVTFVFTDTIGLNESSEGLVPGPEAIRALVKLLREAKDGFNLLLHVVRAGRYADTEKKNYHLFVETIAGRRIPTALIATGCEMFKPMTKWRDENQARLRSELGVTYCDVVCTSFARGEWDDLEEILERRRAESVVAIWEAIHRHATPTPVVLYKHPADFYRLLRKAWNNLCRVLGWRQFILPVNAALQAFLQSLGFGKDEAQDLIEREDL
jgi:GTPase Era involved in 16S rRNA processing